MGIKETLIAIDAIREERLELYSDRTRDFPVPVYKDSISGVIFIDEYYVGDAEYESGTYRGDSFAPSLENTIDTARRLETLKHLYIGKSVMDWGCGKGDFLRGSKTLTKLAIGIELQNDYRLQLQKDGINSDNTTVNIPSNSIDTCFMFHVLEHLENPLANLSEIKRTLVPGGNLVIEIPHANDFLLNTLEIQEFKEFTLWSQHLVLHTRESIGKLLKYAGFEVESISGLQRYSLSNHLNWALNGRPGGHLGKLAVLEDEQLLNSYQNALSKIDANDTLLINAKAL